MYQEFFGLKEAPFSIAPNPHYLYMSKQHHEALAHLVYGVGRDGGFVLLTGEVGTGKTTVCRCFLEQIPADTDVAFILNPKLNAEQLLATICDELGISYINDEVTIKELVDSINLYLLKSHAQGRHTVLIIDEAQNLAPEVLEQLRLLTNLETHEKKLLQIVLLGQPELQDMFLRPDLRQLAQRVTARFHLKELQLSELGPYVRHRLGVAGGKDIVNIFPEKTLKKLYAITTGVPRIINLVCDRAMLGAYTQNQRTVDVRTLERAAREILGSSYPSTLKTPLWFKSMSGGQVALVGSLLALGAMLVWAAQGVHINIAIGPAATASQQAGETAGKIVRAAGESSSSETENAESSAPGAGVVDTLAEKAAVTGLLASEGDATDVANVTTEDSDNADATPPASLVSLLGEEGANNEVFAYRELLAVWSQSSDAQTSAKACQQAKRVGIFCLSRSGSLGYLRHLGMPAVVTLYTSTGGKAYAVLRRLDTGLVTLWLKNQEITISEDEFNKVWRGQFTLMWKAPGGFNSPLQPGAISPLTRWLRDGFAALDKQTPAQGGATYDPALVERVRSFQREMGEEDDGIVGEATLILLSRKLDNGLPLLSQEGLPQEGLSQEGVP